MHHLFFYPDPNQRRWIVARTWITLYSETTIYHLIITLDRIIEPAQSQLTTQYVPDWFQFSKFNCAHQTFNHYCRSDRHFIQSCIFAPRYCPFFQHSKLKITRYFINHKIAFSWTHILEQSVFKNKFKNQKIIPKYFSSNFIRFEWEDVSTFTANQVQNYRHILLFSVHLLPILFRSKFTKY